MAAGSSRLPASGTTLGPDRKEAMQRYHELMAQPRQRVVAANSALAIVDAFLEWTHKHRELGTYQRYKDRLQGFARSVPNLTVNQLKPFHIQQWVDAHGNWSDGHRRGCIIAVQRAFRWAEKLGYIEKNPIRQIEKPPAGKRERIVTEDEYNEIRAATKDSEFRDLVNHGMGDRRPPAGAGSGGISPRRSHEFPLDPAAARGQDEASASARLSHGRSP